ncbi:class I SAM-dependent methyltransferase [Candidatus Omnitrophota bacterium]
MANPALENYKKYCERINYYKGFGYNIEEERSFILEKSYPIYGDILEVGTGKGYFSIELAKEGHSFISVDISEQDQELAKLSMKHFKFEDLVKFKIENAEHLSFDDSSFDIIFSINTIHHLANPIKVIDELVRIVTLEGKIILSDFTKEGLEIMDKSHKKEHKEHEVGKINLTAIEKYLSDKDFNIEKHRSRCQETLIACHPIA